MRERGTIHTQETLRRQARNPTPLGCPRNPGGNGATGLRNPCSLSLWRTRAQSSASNRFRPGRRRRRLGHHPIRRLRPGVHAGHPGHPEQRLGVHRRRVGLLHAGGLRARRSRPHPGEERRQHLRQEHGRCDRRHPGLLRRRLRLRLRRRQRLHRNRGILPLRPRCLRDRRGGRAERCDGLLLPGGLRCNGGHDRLGSHGRADEVLRLPDLLGRDVCLHLPGRGPLDLGRRIDRSARLRWCGVLRLRRLRHRAHDGRHRCSDGCVLPRTSHRQVRRERQAPGDPGPQHPLRNARCVHPVGRLVRLQPRLGARSPTSRCLGWR